MPSADYASSVYPDRWQVLGVELRPFSLGHYFKLKKLGCAFVSDSTERAGMDDLILGIIVCSMSSHPDSDIDPFWVWLNRKKQSVNLWFWNFTRAQKLTPAEFEVLQWGKRIGQIDFVEKANLFNEYINYYQQQPGFYAAEDSKESTPGGHWSHMLYHVAVSKCGYSSVEAFNAPLRRLLADFYKHAESEGCGRMMSEEELKFVGEL